ncbi:hypothetical protein K491DRAFT_721455 [Lophiostoma macrostomum CBS 122681]|uniref:Heterokaryon incompatibility domain-containing protein n=1 Tax=Lophiostoma macrostomum CBS 122681 TaxID=1314788 RepID=A0A6A6STY8_9PLEO|nr:hypothetical protein K491DRAFT_721455 [Lophiostoma macrostomum CBS 122681]
MALPSSSFPHHTQNHIEILDIDEDELDTSNLTAHVVGEDAKARLLPDQHPRTRQNDDADTLLRDLGRLAPSVTKDFIPKRVAKKKLTLRLINDTEFAGEEDTFVALSYCWNKVNHDIPRKEVSPVGGLPFGWVKTVEQFPLPTSAAMFEAVLREKGEKEGLWFDQVCVNQEDENEKSLTVAAIDLIYSNARVVVAALDDIAVEEDELDFLTQYIDQYDTFDFQSDQQPNRGLHPPFMQQEPTFWSLLDRILGSVWFERAWCAHELRMARNHVFLVPCHSDDDETYTFIKFSGSFFLHMLLLASELVNLQAPARNKLTSLIEHFGTLTTQRHRSDSPNPSPRSISTSPSSRIREPPAFVPLISQIFSLKAGGNPLLPEYLRRLDANRDKACITLNASGLPIALKPTSRFQRPNIEDECLRQLLLVGLAMRDPLSLCTTGPVLRLHDGSVSWLSKPTELNGPPNSEFQVRAPDFHVEDLEGLVCSSDGRAEYIQLPLLFLELPHRSTPSTHFATHIHRARTFIDLSIQFQLQAQRQSTWHRQQDLHVWSYTHNASHPRAASLKNVFVQTLSCIFELGPHWLLDTIQSTQGAYTSLTPQAVDVLYNPHLIIQNYLLRPDGQACVSSLLALLATIISRGITWSSGTSERTHGPLIVSVPHTSPVLLPQQLVSPTQYLSPSSASQGSASSPLYPPQLSPYLHPNSQIRSTASPQAFPQTQTQTQMQISTRSPAREGRAIIFAPYAHTKTLLIAIPRALTKATYTELPRAWILTPMHQYTGTAPGSASPAAKQVVCWRLQGKGVLAGDAGFVEGVGRGGRSSGEESGGGGRSHRIYGPEG